MSRSSCRPPPARTQTPLHRNHQIKLLSFCIHMQSLKNSLYMLYKQGFTMTAGDITGRKNRKGLFFFNFYCLKNSSHLSSSVLHLYIIQMCQCFNYVFNVFLRSFSPRITTGIIQMMWMYRKWKKNVSFEDFFKTAAEGKTSESFCIFSPFRLALI